MYFVGSSNMPSVVNEYPDIMADAWKRIIPSVTEFMKYVAR